MGSEAPVTKDQVKAYLSALNPAELRELIVELEERWGVERLQASPPPWPEHMGMPLDPDPEREVVLTGFEQGRKVSVIKVVRRLLGLSLRDAKALVEAAPTPIKRDVREDEAEALRAELREAGATIVVR